METKKSVMDQIASLGEGTMQKLQQNSATNRVMESAIQLKDKVEKLVGGVSDLEKRVATLEDQVAKLSAAQTKKPAARRTAKTAAKS